MQKPAIIVVTAIVLACAFFSCQRTTPDLKGPNFTEIKSLPADYGPLVSVTTLPAAPEWVQLWFQDKDGSIRIVRMHFDAGLMHKDVKIITRN